MGLRAVKQPAAPAGQTTQMRRLKKGETLFAEGENSRAMYLIRSGMIRIFKKKGDSAIEIDTIRAGSVLGELAFLDGNPRSASAEALTECELMEISGPVFQAVLGNMPDWLKILLKTVVSRLRASSTRIRQLEQASQAYDFDKDGKRSAHYVYLSPHDTLKVSSALLLVAARQGVDIRVASLQRYANQIMGIPEAKITTLLDVFAQVGVVKIGGDAGPEGGVRLTDIDFLEQFIAYMNEENQVEPSKQRNLSLRGFLVMSLIAKNLARYPKDAETGVAQVNLAEIRKLETKEGGKEPFRMDEFPELVRLGYAANVSIQSADVATTAIKPEPFTQAYRIQRIIIALRVVNEQKAKGGK